VSGRGKDCFLAMRLTYMSRTHILLLVSVSLSSFAFFTVVPTLPLYLLQLAPAGVAIAWAGVVVGASFFISAIMSPIWGSLADRYGARAMMLRSALALSAAYLLMIPARTPLALLGTRCLAGLAAGFVPAASAMISRVVQREHLGKAMSSLSVARAASSMLGPAVGGFVISRAGFAAGFVMASLSMASAFIIVQFFIRAEPKNDQLAASAVSLLVKVAAPFRTIGRALGISALRNSLLISFLYTTAMTSLQLVIPVFLQSISRSTQEAAFLTGIAFSLGGLASLVFGLGWGALSDRFSYRLMLPSVLASAAVAIAAVVLTSGLFAFLSLFTLYAVILCEVGTLGNLYLLDVSPESMKGQSLGLSDSVSRLASALGPSVGTWFSGLVGITGTFGLVGASLLSCAMLFLVVSRRAETRQIAS